MPMETPQGLVLALGHWVVWDPLRSRQVYTLGSRTLGAQESIVQYVNTPKVPRIHKNHKYMTMA